MTPVFVSVLPCPDDRLLHDVAWLHADGAGGTHAVRACDGGRPVRRYLDADVVFGTAGAVAAPRQASRRWDGVAALQRELSGADTVAFTEDVAALRACLGGTPVLDRRPDAIADVLNLYMEACLPLYALLPSPLAPQWELAHRRVVRDSNLLVARCRERESSTDGGRTAASVVGRLWRTWNAVRVGAERLASGEPGL